MWSLTTDQAGKCIWPGATRATAIIHVVTSRWHLLSPWNELDLPRCNFSPIRQKMSHHLSYIFLYCHPHNRLSQDRLEPITSSSSRASRESETKIWKRLKTEGLNAQHMNTQKATKCISLIKKTFFTTHWTSEWWKGFQLVVDGTGGDCAQNWMRQQSSDSERKLILPKRWKPNIRGHLGYILEQSKCN